MQFPKEEIKNNILMAAKEEFMKKGFEKASIRTITAAAQTSKVLLY
jgi:AcrR family transcriptional regulator